MKNFFSLITQASTFLKLQLGKLRPSAELNRRAGQIYMECRKSSTNITGPRRGSQDYLIDNQGNLRFTETGRRLFGPYFATYGIDISEIRTWDAFMAARAKTSGGFGVLIQRQCDETLLSNGTFSALIRAIAERDFDKADRLEKQLQSRGEIHDF